MYYFYHIDPLCNVEDMSSSIYIHRLESSIVKYQWEFSLVYHLIVSVTLRRFAISLGLVSFYVGLQDSFLFLLGTHILCNYWLIGHYFNPFIKQDVM